MKSTKEQLKEKHDKIVKGLEEAYKAMVEFKKLKNSPIILLEDGVIIKVDPFKVSPTTTYIRNKESSL